MDIKGARVNSVRLTPLYADFLQSDHIFYEGKITMLFTPWLVPHIPDSAWQTLQEKLGNIILEIKQCKKKNGRA